MARLAQRHQVKKLIATAVIDCLDMMYLRSHSQLAPLFALCAERVLFQELLSYSLPASVVDFTGIPLAAHLSLVLFAVGTVG